MTRQHYNFEINMKEDFNDIKRVRGFVKENNFKMKNNIIVLENGYNLSRFENYIKRTGLSNLVERTSTQVDLTPVYPCSNFNELCMSAETCSAEWKKYLVENLMIQIPLLILLFVVGAVFVGTSASIPAYYFLMGI